LKSDNTTEPLPPADKIPLQIGETASETLIDPIYPVIQYGHVEGGGDAIGSGFLYSGKAIPSLRGKYVFSDITTFGRLSKRPAFDGMVRRGSHRFEGPRPFPLCRSESRKAFWDR
jgi:hypothetical protein